MDLTEFFDTIALDCPGVPIPIAVRATRSTLRDFCRKTGVYRKQLTSDELSFDGAIYTIAVPTDTQIVSILSPIGSLSSNARIVSATEADLDSLEPGWRSLSATDQPIVFIALSANTFRVVPNSAQSVASDLKVTILLMPTYDAATIDNEVGTRWFDEIAAGAKALLMVTPGAKWFNPELAAVMAAQYEDGKLEAQKYINAGRHASSFDGRGRVKTHWK